MATVVLPFEDHGKVTPLPPVCISCGKSATRTIKMQFSGRVVKFLGIRVYAPGGAEEYVIVKTPLCDAHPFMGQAKWMIILGFLLLLPFFALGALTKPWIHHYLVAFPLIAMVLVGSAFIGYVFFTSIDGQGFDKEGVTVTRVSRKFVQALEDHEWTREEFEEGIRKHRKGRLKPKPPFWISPYFFAPVGVALAFAIFTPVGYLVASKEPFGPWPAGPRAGQQPGPGGPGVQPGQPVGEGPPRNPEPFNPKSFGGLVGYWPLDDGRGNAAQDVSGNGILALLHGGEWVDGIRGKALRLDGKKDYLDLGPADNRLSFAAGAPFTVAGWVNTTADEGVISSFRRRGQAFPVIDLLVKDGKVRGWVRDDTSGTGGAIPVGGSIKDGQWHHVALTRQADGTVELYLDGVFQAKHQGKNSGGPITTDVHTLGSDRFMVEARRPRPAYFTGSIDEFCVFNRALTAEDVALLMGGKK